MEESVSIPEAVRHLEQESVYRVALHTVVQVLMLVGPVMREWQKLHFSSTFELLRRVVNRLNEINEQLDTLSLSGQSAADERFELMYRDYRFERFHRVETGTVQMTTNQNVDLRELFVMPRVLTRKAAKEDSTSSASDESEPMDLAAARRFFEERVSVDEGPRQEKQAQKQAGISALEQITSAFRNVIIGVPGSGKSTFLEWLQLKVASVEQEFVPAEKQAIPLLLRVRQLDPTCLPTGAAMIEKATVSSDRANLMPDGWIERQMKSGRVLFMLDGLDEADPNLRDACILPWLQRLCIDYPRCGYLVSSRPVGYPLGALRSLDFVECDLLDFGDDEIGEYTRHWCTAIRLARNEPEEEARREGNQEGTQILESFKVHPHISNLARNPLMLSAVCLVNYFEAGELPRDRAVLYRLCVEGLLHHWDHRRGIHSEFTLSEKLRVCREVALAMQADDRAEYEAERVCGVFAEVLNDDEAAARLLEHVRYRTGLLLERRPGVFAFAHLTFQEYLAARAVHEGNRSGLDAKQLVNEHSDPRWKEVIALYNGADIISMSLGFDYYEPLFAKVFDMLIEQYGILPVAAIGNENYGNSSSPGSSYSALSVGAVEKIRRGTEVAAFSSGASLVFPGDQFNTVVTKPDIVAPGVQVYSCIPPQKRPDGVYDYAYFDGTSMATPHVAGVAALLMAAKPQAQVTEIIKALKDTAKHPAGRSQRPDNRWGYGLVQPAAALSALG